MDRRKFIHRTSMGTAAMVTAFHIPSFAQNRKLKMGLIGSGWYGMVVANAALKTGNVEIAAVCDVDSEHMNNSAAELESLQGSKPAQYKDYRELLEVNGLDAVIIASPPHWHALQFIAACEKGLPVYCEKPLAYDVNEGKAMLKAAGNAGNLVQVGFQRRQSEAFKKAGSLIGNGTTGKIYQIEAQIHYNPGTADTTVQDPPASLDWDAWCGPAPMLPYKPSIGHMAWRHEKEYGNGHFVDWGIHHIDIIRKIMNFDLPNSYNVKGGNYILKDRMTTPDTLIATLQFGEIPLTWKHRLWGPGDLNTQFNNGIFFYGEKATLFASDNKLVLMPSGRNQSQQEMDIATPDMQERHVAEFVKAVLANDKSLISCTLEDAFRSTTSVQMGMASYYTGSEVKWDAQSQSVLNNDAAAKLMAREYRKGYKRPEV